MESTRLSRLGLFCDRVLEAGWLLAVTITPVFFNVYSSRVFEPDKLTTMRALATLMAMFWLVRYMDARANGEKAFRFDLQTPLVLPVVLTLMVYVISSIFSVVGVISVYGSYQRLQGLYTLASYLVIFFTMITSLRTRNQLSRLITVLILNSVPVALYGIVQHSGQDPLPWAGDVETRVASNMGNAIFVAAYLIMIVPLTAARLVESIRDIMLREDFRISDVLRTGSYLALIVTQVITIYYSGSRGPWVGLAIAVFLFPYLAFLLLQRRALNEDSKREGIITSVLKSLALGLGSSGIAGGLFLGVYTLLSGRGDISILVSLGMAGIVFCGIWIYFVVEKKGWRWLWMAWLWIGALLFAALLVINIPGPVQDMARGVPSLRRMTTITKFDDGTGKVRGLIWQGAVDLIAFHEPLTFPDGSKDSLNILRPLIGYGPESMYVAYNSFYPPDLGHYESRTASPDRSHNETLDSLVITGLLGFAVYLLTFGSVFAWALHWLGFIENRKQLTLYITLCVVSAIILFGLLTSMEGPYLFAIAVPLGFVFGTGIYLMIVPVFLMLRSQKQVTDGVNSPIQPHAIWIIGILVAVMAHFVEINVGIAIAATRTTFWVLAALLVIMGMEWVPSLGLESTETIETVEAAHRSRGKSRQTRQGLPVWLASILAISIAAGFLMGTLAFDFVNNPDRISNAWSIFWSSLVVHQQGTAVNSFSALKILGFTWLVYGMVAVSEADNDGVYGSESKSRWWKAALIFCGLSLAIMLVFGLLLSAHQSRLTQMQLSTIEQVVEVADDLSNLLLYYYGLVIVSFVAIGAVLVSESGRASGKVSGLGAAVLAVTMVLGLVLINNLCYNPIRADIIFKQGKVFADEGDLNQKQIGILHYERALEYVPHEDYYQLFLGKAYLELSQSITGISTAQREGLFLKTEEVLKAARVQNPLNTDHSANLARFYKSWATRLYNDAQAEDLPDADKQALLARYSALIDQSLDEYGTALILSPNNVLIWNELAQLYAVDFQDLAQAEQVIAHSLELDSTYQETWLLLGRVRAAYADIDGATKAYQEALVAHDSCEVREEAGVFYIQQAMWAEAQELLEPSIDKCPKYDNLWLMYHALSIAYGQQGRTTDALIIAQTAYSLAPESQRPSVQGLIDDLQNLLNPAPDSDVVTDTVEIESSTP